MHTIHLVTEPRRKVFLLRYTGEIYVYDSYREFLSFIRSDIIENMGKSFRDVRCYYVPKWVHDINAIYGNERIVNERRYIYTHWIARWDYKSGSIIDPVQIKKDWDEYEQEIYHDRVRKHGWLYRWNNRIFSYRNGPVPCIGRSHSHRGTFYRCIKTTHERRWSLTEREDAVRWRAKRNFRNIPNSWDDRVRFKEKNWKSFRKHQWKD